MLVVVRTIFWLALTLGTLIRIFLHLSDTSTLEVYYGFIAAHIVTSGTGAYIALAARNGIERALVLAIAFFAGLTVYGGILHLHAIEWFVLDEGPEIDA
jgi:hypothetical protein